MRDRALSRSELRAFWKRIQARERAPLRFHLLTGCRRVQQLARVTQGNFDSDIESMQMLDNKCRRNSPRQRHVLALPATFDAMREMHSAAFGPYLPTLAGSKSSADYAGIFKRVHKIAFAVQEAGTLPSGIFTPGDLRRTVETRRAEAGVSREDHTRLRSRGLGGVQRVITIDRQPARNSCGAGITFRPADHRQGQGCTHPSQA